MQSSKKRLIVRPAKDASQTAAGVFRESVLEWTRQMKTSLRVVEDRSHEEDWQLRRSAVIFW